MNYCYSGTLSERLSDSGYFGAKHIFPVPVCDAKCGCWRWLTGPLFSAMHCSSSASDGIQGGGLLLPELEYLRLREHQAQSGLWSLKMAMMFFSFITPSWWNVFTLCQMRHCRHFSGVVIWIVLLFSIETKFWMITRSISGNYAPISCFINEPYFIFYPWKNKLAEP